MVSAETPEISFFDNGALLNAQQFVALAQQCQLPLTHELLKRLKTHSVLLPLAGGHFSPAHLWVLARYFNAARVYHHIGATRPTPRSSAQQEHLNQLAQDAAALVAVLNSTADAPRSDVVARVRAFAEAQDPLGHLASLLPFLRDDLRESLRGAALLAALLRSQLDWMSRTPETSDANARGPATAADAPDEGENSADAPAERENSADAPAECENSADAPAERKPPADADADHEVGRSLTVTEEGWGQLESDIQGDATSSVLGAQSLVGWSVGSDDAEVEAPPAASAAAAESEAERPVVSTSTEEVGPGTDRSEAFDAGADVEEAPQVVVASEDAAAGASEALDDGDVEAASENIGADTSEPQDDGDPEVPPEDAAAGASQALDDVDGEVAQGDAGADALEAPGADDAEVTPSVEADAPEEERAAGAEIEPEAEADPTEVEGAADAEVSPEAEGAEVLDESQAEMVGAQVSSVSDGGAEKANPDLKGDDSSTETEPAQALSLDEQIAQLNELRDRFMKSKAWDKLAALYLDKIELFTQPAEKRTVYINVGMICERKLKDLPGAIAAYEEAKALSLDESLYEMLSRAYMADERWESQSALTREMRLAASGSAAALLGIREANVLSERLGRDEEALEVLCEVFDISEAEHKDAALESIAAILESTSSPGYHALAAVSRLEASWGDDDASTPRLVASLTQLHESFKEAGSLEEAGEMMTRVASIHYADEAYQDAFFAFAEVLACGREGDEVYERIEMLAELLDASNELAGIYSDEIERGGDSERLVTLGGRLAGVYRNVGDRDGVRRAWQLVNESAPDSVEVLSKLRALHALSGDNVARSDVLERLCDLLEGDALVDVLLQSARLRTAGLKPNASDELSVLTDLDMAVAQIQRALDAMTPETGLAGEVIQFAEALLARSDKAVAYQLSARLEQYHLAQNDQRAIIQTCECLANRLAEDADGSEVSALWQRIGQVYRELGEPEMSFVYNSKALRADPQNEEVLAALELEANTNNRWDEIAAIWEEILEQDKRLPWLRYLARLYRDRLHSKAQAEEVFVELHRLAPEDEEALDFLEAVYEDRSDWVALIDVFETRLQMFQEPGPRSQLLLRIVVVALNKLHNVREALDATASLLELFDDDAWIERLESIYREGGQLAALMSALDDHVEGVQNKRRRFQLQMKSVGLLAELGEVDAAIERLTALRSDAPSEPAIRRQVLKMLGSFYGRAGRELEAYAVLRALWDELKASPQRGAARVQEMEGVLLELAKTAEVALESQDEAVLYLRELLELSPGHEDALLRLEAFYGQKRNWDGLLALLEEQDRRCAQKKSPGLAVVKAQLASLLRARFDEPARERAVLIELLSLDPDASATHLERLVDLAQRLGHWEEALEQGEAFLKRLDSPEDIAGMLTEMAQIARDGLNSPARAVALLERAKVHQPGHLEILESLANLYYMAGRRDDVVTIWQELLEQDEHLDAISVSERVRVCRMLADALSQRPRQAAGVLERALLEAEEDPGALAGGQRQAIHRQLAGFYQGLEDYAAMLSHLQAIESVEKYLQPAEKLTALYLELGEVALKARQVKLSEQYFIIAIEADNGNMLARLGLAEALVVHERWRDAQELLEFLSAHQSDFTNPRDHGRFFLAYGKVFRAFNNTRRAEELFNQARALAPELLT